MNNQSVAYPYNRILLEKKNSKIHINVIIWVILKTADWKQISENICMIPLRKRVQKTIYRDNNKETIGWGWRKELGEQWVWVSLLQEI